MRMAHHRGNADLTVVGFFEQRLEAARRPGKLQ
jgi:hypothetical protein